MVEERYLIFFIQGKYKQARMKTIAQNRPQCSLESMNGGKGKGIAMLVVGDLEKSKINIGEIFTEIINQLFLRDFDLISCKDID